VVSFQLDVKTIENIVGRRRRDEPVAAQLNVARLADQHADQYRLAELFSVADGSVGGSFFDEAATNILAAGTAAGPFFRDATPTVLAAAGPEPAMSAERVAASIELIANSLRKDFLTLLTIDALQAGPLRQLLDDLVKLGVPYSGASDPGIAGSVLHAAVMTDLAPP
jgi:hypothetical protein